MLRYETIIITVLNTYLVVLMLQNSKQHAVIKAGRDGVYFWIPSVKQGR